MTTTGTDAYEAIRAHHWALGDGLTERANAVFRAAVDRRPHEPAVADFVAYVGEEVLPHAAAEEKTIYPAVVAHTHLGNLLGQMHHNLDPAAPEESAHHIDCGHEAADPELDVRELRPAQRHEAVFDAYTDLAPGTGFVLVNDHDPKPLCYQFEAEHAGEFTWDALESGPAVWRVRVGRTPA